MTESDSLVGTQFGKYHLSALLGRGGMGEVYEASDTDKGRTVAVKILRAEFAQDERFRARFLRESHAAAILQEPHVIPIHDWGEIDGNLFIDMRLVRGRTLHDLARTAPLEPERAVAIVQQVAAALDAAHAHGLIHRDVKPQNVIVTPADFAYLLDFGIAEVEGDSRLTMDGTQIGSFAYMAPERFNDEPCAPATDIYALACVLYEALAGSTPFPGNSHESQIAAHISSVPPRPSLVNPLVPPALDEVIARGMAKEPDDRYGSASALCRAAQRALKASGYVSAADAGTMAAPNPLSAAPGSAHVPAQATDATGATAVLDPNGGRSRHSTLPLAVIGIVAALLLGAVGVVIGLLVSQSPEQSASPPQPTPTFSVAVPTVVQTVTASPSSSPKPVTLPSPKTAARPDPEAASSQQLRQIAANDRAFVANELADRWVPQLSSKRPGVVDQGIEWDNSLTLQEHLQLRQQYNAKLLWSGEWSTFDAANYWVTIVPITYTDPAGALSWCRSAGFDRDHCIAKVVSTTRPVRGSTALN